MDELVDFEELIDVKPFLASVLDTTESQKSSQEPIGDVLDKMCKAMSASNIDIDNVETDTENKETVSNEAIIDLDEFESFLAATSSSKCCIDVDKIDSLTNDMTTDEGDRVKALIPYEIPIRFGDIGTTMTESVTNELDEEITNLLDDSNDLEKDKKILSLFDLAVNYRNITAGNTERNVDFNYIETNETKVETNETKVESNEVKVETNEVKVEPNEVKVETNGVKVETNELKDETNETKVEMDTLTADKEPELINLDDWEDIVLISDDSDDGYNSSDFEFISENEATKAGILTKPNYKPALGNIPANKTNIDLVKNPAESRNRRNEASYADYIKYSKYRYHRCYAQTSQVSHHVMPEGEKFLDLFRGQYSPMIINNLRVLKNKSVAPAAAMTPARDLELGFRIAKNEDNEEYREDAEDCAKLILSTYPGENRRKRRRH